MTKMNERFVKPLNKKAFAIGMSNGAICLTHASAAGKLKFLIAGVCLWINLDYTGTGPDIEHCMNGLASRAMGAKMLDICERNVETMAPHFISKGIDLEYKIQYLKSSNQVRIKPVMDELIGPFLGVSGHNGYFATGDAGPKVKSV